MIPLLQEKLDRFKVLFPRETIIMVRQMQGAEHYILDINNEWICKIPKNNEEKILYPEVNMLEILKGRMRANIPRVVCYEPNLLVYKKIPGVELTKTLYESLTETKKNKLVRKVAYFLYELHNLFSVSDLIVVGFKETDWPWSPEQLLEHKTLIKDKELKKIFLYFLKHYQVVRATKKLALIHNDMNLNNIIIDKETGKLNGIIDFTDVALDDPYLDLRARYNTPDQFMIDVMKLYVEIDDIDDLNTGMRKAYLYYMAVEFSRYITCLQSHQANELEKIKQRILEGDIFYDQTYY